MSARILEVSNRLREVQLENRDFRQVIKTYDSPQTFSTAPRPYIGTVKYYAGGFSIRNHKDLAVPLHNIKGRACISYPHPLVEKLYPDWRKEVKEVSCWSFCITSQRKNK